MLWIGGSAIKDSGGGQTWTVYNGTSPDALPYADFNGSGDAAYALRLWAGHGQWRRRRRAARPDELGRNDRVVPDRQAGLGSGFVSSAGSALDHVVYDSFGNITTETNASNGDRFKFAGMEWDATVRHYFDHARWYGPIAGRFTVLDPKGFGGGDENLYRDVKNNITNDIDITGTCSLYALYVLLYYLNANRNSSFDLFEWNETQLDDLEVAYDNWRRTSVALTLKALQERNEAQAKQKAAARMWADDNKNLRAIEIYTKATMELEAAEKKHDALVDQQLKYLRLLREVTEARERLDILRQLWENLRNGASSGGSQ